MRCCGSKFKIQKKKKKFSKAILLLILATMRSLSVDNTIFHRLTAMATIYFSVQAPAAAFKGNFYSRVASKYHVCWHFLQFQFSVSTPLAGVCPH